MYLKDKARSLLKMFSNLKCVILVYCHATFIGEKEQFSQWFFFFFFDNVKVEKRLRTFLCDEGMTAETEKLTSYSTTSFLHHISRHLLLWNCIINCWVKKKKKSSGKYDRNVTLSGCEAPQLLWKLCNESHFKAVYPIKQHKWIVQSVPQLWTQQFLHFSVIQLHNIGDK